MKFLTILGSTGSIGQNALKIVSACPERFQVRYLAAGKNGALLLEQVRQFRPQAVAIADERAAGLLISALKGEPVEILIGKAGLNALAARPVDLVLNAIVGMAGLEPTYFAIESGNSVALSNKESLVMAGELIMRRAHHKGVALLPVDSEHSAIWQCLRGEPGDSIRKLIITGSGGPFRERAMGTFASITPEEALRHPVWRMGRKITIDSATLFNKCLEIIEAHWLFNITPAQIEVVIHPQSIVHSLVEFVDGSVKAQLGIPDMRLPIQYALNYPERLPPVWEELDLVRLKTLTFASPDPDKFPALRLAYAVLESGGTAPAILNVANELAVHAFLNGRIRFHEIAQSVERTLAAVPPTPALSIEQILAVEPAVRRFLDAHLT